MPAFAALGADLRFTGRLFRKNPGFSLIAIVSMALGIGASSAIFSLVYAVLLDPYPYKNADRMIAPAFSDKRGPRGRVFYTVPDFLELRRSSKTLEDAFLADQRPFIATGGIPDLVRGVAYSPNAFDFMGVPALLGRTFTPSDIPSPQTPPAWPSSAICSGNDTITAIRRPSESSSNSIISPTPSLESCRRDLRGTMPKFTSLWPWFPTPPTPLPPWPASNPASSSKPPTPNCRP